MRAWLLSVLTAALVALPALAEACPACARDTGSGVGRMVLLASMIFFPFAVVAVVLRAIRRADPRASTPRATDHP